jgi:Putative addiction module component
MSGLAPKVPGEAMSLPGEDRSAVARELVESLAGPSDADVKDTWVVEIERRAGRVLADLSGAAGVRD